MALLLSMLIGVGSGCWRPSSASVSVGDASWTSGEQGVGGRLRAGADGARGHPRPRWWRRCGRSAGDRRLARSLRCWLARRSASAEEERTRA
eukprot:5514691-Pleurochrysis_carterae.AAC.1